MKNQKILLFYDNKKIGSLNPININETLTIYEFRPIIGLKKYGDLSFLMFDLKFNKHARSISNFIKDCKVKTIVYDNKNKKVIDFRGTTWFLYNKSKNYICIDMKYDNSNPLVQRFLLCDKFEIESKKGDKDENNI